MKKTITRFIKCKTPEDVEKHFPRDPEAEAKHTHDMWTIRYGDGLPPAATGGSWSFENVSPYAPQKVDSAWLLEQLELYTKRMVETAKKKNADYAGASVEPFANFSHVESLGIATTEQGFLTRMTDKLCRVATFAKKGILQVSDESVEDTLLDLANYALLMAAYVKAKKAGTL